MAFSLGNLIKNAGNSALKVISPMYNTVSNLYQSGKSALSSLTQPAQNTPSPAPSSLFSVSGNGNGVPTPNGINVPQPNLLQSSGLSTPSPSQSLVSGTSSVVLKPLATSTPKTPTVPATIPSSILTPTDSSVVTVPSPTVPPLPATTFAGTQQSPTPTTPGQTPAAPSAPAQGSTLPSDLINPTSDAGILETQKRIGDVSSQLQGKSAALAAAQIQAKVPEYQQQLNDVISQINTLNSDAAAEQIRIQGKPIASEFQSRQIGAVERDRTVRALGLSAVASALQGNLALATDYAQKSVDAKFAPLEAELDTLKQQLEFNKDNFARSEQGRVQKLTLALQDREQALATEKEKQTQINSIALEAAKNGADAQTLNSILNSTNLSDALGTARGALAKKNGIGIYNLSESQANIASKLADDFEKATGNFSQVRDAFAKIQAVKNGNESGISDTALIFSYMKMLDPTSVVREGEFATVQNAGGIPQRVMQAYNQALNGQKLGALRDDILKTSETIFQRAQETQNAVTKTFNDRAMAYGIPTDLVTRDVSAGVTSGAPVQTSGATRDTIYAKLKAKYPGVPDDKLQAAAQKYVENPALQKDLGFSQDLGTSVNRPAVSGVGFRTDRHNNPTAFTTDVARAAGLKEGVDYAIGDAFPNNPSLKTARLLGDPIDTTIRVIDTIGFQTSSGKPRWDYINIPRSQWNALSYEQKKGVIAKMYAHEGGTQLRNILV